MYSKNFLQRCDGYSGADLSALVTEAAMAAFKEHISRAARSSSLEPVPLTSEVRVFWRHFDSAFDKVKPSVTGKDKQHYETLKRKQQVRTNFKKIMSFDTFIQTPKVVLTFI